MRQTERIAQNAQRIWQMRLKKEGRILRFEGWKNSDTWKEGCKDEKMGDRRRRNRENVRCSRENDSGTLYIWEGVM